MFSVIQLLLFHRFLTNYRLYLEWAEELKGLVGYSPLALLLSYSLTPNLRQNNDYIIVIILT
jgi:hypothetical protein